MTSVDSEDVDIKQISMREHIKIRSMWAGSKKNQTIESYVIRTVDGESSMTVEKLKYPPALMKAIDEIIVNAIDHHVTNPTTVKSIKVTLHPDQSITIYNDGPGLPVHKKKNINGVEMYSPQMIFSELLSSSNLDDSKERIVGGQNGIGAKLTVIFSKIFTVETYNQKHKTLYTQTFRNGMEIIDPPILKIQDGKPFTKITFTPDYDEFKIKPEKFADTLNDILLARLYFAAAYIPKVKFEYNGTPIPIKNFTSFCNLFTNNEILLLKMEKEGAYPWEVGFAISEGKSQVVSMINGIIVEHGGTHIQYIEQKLVENLRPYVEKEIKKSGVKFNKNYIINNVIIFMKGTIVAPEFLSQTKEALKTPIDNFEGYDVPSWDPVWELLKPAILSTFLKKHIGDVKQRANRKKVDVPKYQEANFCRDAKKCLECGLICVEGDSADGTAKFGLLSKASENFNPDWFGTFSLGGVPMNALKESVQITGSKDDSSMKIVRKKKNAIAVDKPVKKTAKTTDDILKELPKRLPNSKLLENERISSLIKVLGLDFNKSYEFTDLGEKEYKSLRYGFIVGLTDQDLDGFNIFGLLTTFILTYWPALLFRDYIRRINTPVVRAKPTAKKAYVEEFYSESQFREWLKEDPSRSKKYKFNYYKGLGSHDQRNGEAKQLFVDIEDKITTYEFDDKTFKMMTDYYGDDPSIRKKILASEVEEEKIVQEKMPMSKQFYIDSKLYQRDNIIRKLLNLVDGFVSSRRKVFYTARKKEHDFYKVAQLAADTVSKADYHHGETGLAVTITRMAQCLPMARNLPLLQAQGNFGSRARGYSDAAESRYIFTTINWRLTDAMFRKEDEYVLQYELEDGKRCEPKYYVPIIPYALCESEEIPATGWKITTHARHIDDIFKNIRNMISGKIDSCEKLRPWCREFKGTIKKFKNKEYYVGIYEYDKDNNVVHITELPPDICSSTYLIGADGNKVSKKGKPKKGIQTKQYVKECEDKTTNDNVDIYLYLEDGAYDAITSNEKYGNEVFDPFEMYFELTSSIIHHINLVNHNNEVVEYKSYEAVFNDWYVFRKALYSIRVERELILINLELKMLKNMQRFNKAHSDYGISGKTTEEELIELLTKEKYDIFNESVVNEPKYTDVKSLVLMATSVEYGADYDYILKMSYKHLTKDAFQKREARIKELLERLNYLEDEPGTFKGAKVWLYELDQLEAVIKKGLETTWGFSENQLNFRPRKTKKSKK